MRRTGLHHGTLKGVMALSDITRYDYIEEWPSKLPSSETLEQMAPFIEVPFLGDSRDFVPNGYQAFSPDELLGVARELLSPRVEPEDQASLFTRTILAQAEALDVTIEGISNESGIPMDRLNRILALGGWSSWSPEIYAEIIRLGTWYGDVEKLTRALGAQESKKPAPQREDNGKTIEAQ